MVLAVWPLDAHKINMIYFFKANIINARSAKISNSLLKPSVPAVLNASTTYTMLLNNRANK